MLRCHIIIYISSVSLCVCLFVEVLKPRSSSVHLSRSWNPDLRMFVCQGLKTHISVCSSVEVLKPRFPYVRLSRSWNLDLVCPSLKVLKPKSQIEIPNRFQNRQGLKKCPLELEGPKTIIKSWRWRSPISPLRPGSWAINQALCYKWTRTGPVCFQGLSPTPTRVPELGRFSPFSL
jgi:hypothetical protein